jgi:alpha-L-fucosidase
MKTTFVTPTCAGLLLFGAVPALSAPTSTSQTSVGGQPMSAGPFDGTMGSMSKYRCPAWFRDAKFGIWSHWGPQAVPMEGDWYARNMYIQGHGQNQYHVATYGPPSKFGYKDIIPLWKAEKWNPETLMDLYVKAGAKYFVSMGVHHDNFDLWNSKYNPWNAVKMGPKRDVLGEWQKAARKRGLRFGVSEHLGASYTWYQVSHGADKTGPLAGVPYDGADPKNWSLYHNPTKPGDTEWLTNDPANQANWQLRIRDLIDNYHPDLLYSDSAFPFGSIGTELVSHFYNDNIQRHGGKQEAVYNCKQESGGRWVQDVERGVLEGINPDPWQTDTSMGDWFYSRHQGYKTPAAVIHMLCDIVSKNGNLLINIVQRPDGSIDDESLTMLQELAAWMPVNGEAIYGTRPWTVYGEGQAAAGGAFGEDRQKYTFDDVRFTRKGDSLYAICLGWPQAEAGKPAKAVIKALATGSPFVTGDRLQVQLLGTKGKLSFQRTQQGLEISLPASAPTKYAVAFKITGLKTVATVTPANLSKWRRRLIPGPDKSVTASVDGSLQLTPDKAELHGGLRVQGQGDQRNIGYWDNPNDSISWDEVNIAQPGTYRVEVQAATIHASSTFTVDIDGKKFDVHVPSTGGWDAFQTIALGTVNLKSTDPISVKVTPVAANWQPANIQSIRIIKASIP